MSKTLLAVLFFLSVQICSAQFSFKSLVLDETQQPIAAVTATIGKNEQVAISDTAGYFSFNYTSGQFMLRLSHVGFEDVLIKVNGNLPPMVIMIRNNNLLPETVVKAFERNGRNNTLAAAVTVLSKIHLKD